MSLPDWHRAPFTAQGIVLYYSGQPLAICASPGLAGATSRAVGKGVSLVVDQ